MIILYEIYEQCTILSMHSVSSFFLSIVGKTVNHCVLMAQLYTEGVSRGIHMFMVQVRDLDTHLPLPG